MMENNIISDIIRELTEFASKQYELGDAAQHFSKVRMTIR